MGAARRRRRRRRRRYRRCCATLTALRPARCRYMAFGQDVPSMLLNGFSGPGWLLIIANGGCAVWEGGWLGGTAGLPPRSGHPLCCCCRGAASHALPTPSSLPPLPCGPARSAVVVLFDMTSSFNMFSQALFLSVEEWCAHKLGLHHPAEAAALGAADEAWAGALEHRGRLSTGGGAARGRPRLGAALATGALCWPALSTHAPDPSPSTCSRQAGGGRRGRA